MAIITRDADEEEEDATASGSESESESKLLTMLGGNLVDDFDGTLIFGGGAARAARTPTEN